MPVTMHHTRRDALLNSVPKADALKAKVDQNFVLSDDELRDIGQLLRLACMRAGYTQDEAMDALGIKSKSQFSEMLDGKQKLWAHVLLRPSARAIWKELLVIVAKQAGECEVERVIRVKEG